MKWLRGFAGVIWAAAAGLLLFECYFLQFNSTGVAFNFNIVTAMRIVVAITLPLSVAAFGANLFFISDIADALDGRQRAVPAIPALPVAIFWWIFAAVTFMEPLLEYFGSPRGGLDGPNLTPSLLFALIFGGLPLALGVMALALGKIRDRLWARAVTSPDGSS